MDNSNQIPSDSVLGSQPSTQNPQASNNGVLGENTSSEVQPMSSSDLLSPTEASAPLIVDSVPVVGLSSTSTTTQVAARPVVQHKTNTVMLGFTATLFVAALVMFWSFTKQAKITTK